uniref:Polyprotein n=1 Tax=Peronospora matthiolae TaxID=2874970 RepID=A0AAV1TZS5_9STRA
MDCKVHASRHLLRSAQSHETDTQADVQGLENGQEYLEILEDVEGSEVSSKWCGSTTEDARIECWSDADFAADKADRKSVSGCVITMDSAVVLLSCKKQSGVSLSTMEAEFISASQAGRELLGTKELLNELKLRVREPMPMWIDNQAAIKQLESEKSSSSAKHVDMRFKFICHHARTGMVVPRFNKSENMMAKILTKALPAPRMEELRTMFKLKAAQDDTEEEC